MRTGGNVNCSWISTSRPRSIGPQPNPIVDRPAPCSMVEHVHSNARDQGTGRRAPGRSTTGRTSFTRSRHAIRIACRSRRRDRQMLARDENRRRLCSVTYGGPPISGSTTSTRISHRDRFRGEQSRRRVPRSAGGQQTIAARREASRSRAREEARQSPGRARPADRLQDVHPAARCRPVSSAPARLREQFDQNTSARRQHDVCLREAVSNAFVLERAAPWPAEPPRGTDPTGGGGVVRDSRSSADRVARRGGLPSGDQDRHAERRDVSRTGCADRIDRPRQAGRSIVIAGDPSRPSRTSTVETFQARRRFDRRSSSRR